MWDAFARLAIQLQALLKAISTRPHADLSNTDLYKMTKMKNYMSIINVLACLFWNVTGGWNKVMEIIDSQIMDFIPCW
jgi:hypothetical protein